MRKEERHRILEEFERREREAPKQHSLLQIKTAVTRYPTINYVQPFTNEEIMEGKKCLLNHMKRTPEAEVHRLNQIEMTSAKKKRTTSKNKFTLNVEKASGSAAGHIDNQRAVTPDKKGAAVDQDLGDDNGEEKKEEEIKPRHRAPGGVWIRSSDFPHSFQHLIVYHNMNKFENKEVYQDAWLDGTQPYVPNEKNIYIKLEVDQDIFTKFKQDNGLDQSLTLKQVHDAC